MRNLALMFVLIGAGPVSAHGLDLNVRVAGPTVTITATFDDDTPIADAAVTVVAVTDDRLIFQGVTTVDGLCTFPTPTAGEYEVRLNAGAGHRAKRKLVIENPNDTNVNPDVGNENRAEKRIPMTLVGLGIILLFSLALIYYLRRNN